MTDLQTVSGWESSLGLLAFPLRKSTPPDERVVLLNGGSGHLCLDVSGRQPDQGTRSEIWSSDVGHYVSIQGDDLYVQRWDRPANSIERYRLAQVQENLNKFHRYLSESPPLAAKSVVTHALRVFRQLREAAGRHYTGEQALEGFLALIASAALDKSPASLSDEQNLSATALEVAQSIRAADWDALRARLVRERPTDQLKLDLDLVLRHAAGALFQEAHLEALFTAPDQLRLDGVLLGGVMVGEPTAATLGVHYTPASLARALVEFAFRARPPGESRSVTILDPACGSGEFLRESARRLQKLGYSGRINLIGADVSRAACTTTEFLLNWEFGTTTNVQFEIWCGDSLSDDAPWPTKADYVLMNPPFVNWRDMVPDQQERVRELLGEEAGARPDLAMAFLWKAADSIRDGGVIGAVIPASILDGTSAVGLRQRLNEKAPPALTARLGSHSIFPNATVDAGIFIGTTHPAHTPLALWADHRAASASRAFRALRISPDWAEGSPVLEIGDGYAAYEAPDLFAEPSHGWAPRPYRQWQLSRQHQSLPKVGDIFAVQQGAITGLNDVFLLTGAEFASLPETERWYFRPAVVNGSIIGGTLRPKVFVFYPYGDLDISDEDQLRKSVPQFYEEMLAPAREELLDRSRINERNWWRLSEHRAWQVNRRPKLLSTYFGDAGSFGFDEDGEYVVVQGYGWAPRREHRRFARSMALAYLAILNSRVFSDLLAASSSNLESGAFNLSKRYVERIPLPNLFSKSFPDDLRSSLAEIGSAIAEGGLTQLAAEAREKQRELVEASYDFGII